LRLLLSAFETGTAGQKPDRNDGQKSDADQCARQNRTGAKLLPAALRAI
jgi:hypothetical protein